MAKMKRICVQRPVKKLPTRYFCEDSPPRKSVHISADRNVPDLSD
jgi:hypothetical protein